RGERRATNIGFAAITVAALALRTNACRRVNATSDALTRPRIANEVGATVARWICLRAWRRNAVATRTHLLSRTCTTRILETAWRRDTRAQSASDLADQ